MDYLRRSAQPTSLLEIIADVRSRWRLKLALRGTVRVAGAICLLFLLAAYGMEWARFSGPSVIIARVAFLAALVAAVFWFLVQPLRR